MAQRVIAYIDGFNLYFGLKAMGWRRYYWLDLFKLSRNLLKTNQELVAVKYFSARISAGDKSTPPGIKQIMEAKRRRQAIYLEALSTTDNLVIYEGHYLNKKIVCNKCGNSWQSPEEKMTDVNIATEMLTDAFDNRFDTALLISGDSDLVPPVLALRGKYPDKRVVAAFPPARVSERLKKEANAYFVIGEANLRKSMFADELLKKDGYLLRRPNQWKRNVPPVKK